MYSGVCIFGFIVVMKFIEVDMCTSNSLSIIYNITLLSVHCQMAACPEGNVVRTLTLDNILIIWITLEIIRQSLF